MKNYKNIVWFIMALFFALLVFVAVAFTVDDMTLAKGEVKELNEGWVMTWPNGNTEELADLPYLGKSSADELIVLENTIPSEFFGKTMAFLSADKSLRVWMDEELIYEFGINDKRGFGHTPGSVYNFINIPSDLEKGELKMEMISPYDDYAARVSKVTVGERDILILKLLRDNIFFIGLNMLILVCGIVFLLLFVIQKSAKQDTRGMQYLFGYCLVTSLYYFVETKTLHIFYGNQTVYSVLVFLCLMLIPFFISLYYSNGELGRYKLRWKILIGLIYVNIGVQLILQLTNLVDFMNMAFFSHALIALTILIVGKSYLDIIIYEKKKNNKVNKSTLVGMGGLLFMGIGGTIDIVRMYTVAVGDMGMFSRFGTTCFSMIMLAQHFTQVIKGYTEKAEQNATLLKNEMEYIGRKNKQLEAANKLAEEARQDAIAANTAKDKFLAHMSHEIRTPINAVLGMDTMILRETKEPNIKEYAFDIQNAGQNLLSLINDILDFSKIESGKLEIINVEYDFSSLVHDISNMITAKMKSKKLDLKIYVDENIPSKLLGDDVRIRQVLVNLLNNAVKYTPEGEVVLRIDGRKEGRKVVLDFSVEDTGIGIKEEDIAKLFDEFERIEEKRNRNIEGSGLGLNITTQLLALMNSKLNVESVYGKGSKFFFTLEQQIVDSTPIGDLEKRIKEQSTEYKYKATFVAPEAKVLVVDDNLTNLKVFVSLLKSTKINIDVVDSGKACLEMIKNKYYDLIFLDHMMPDMDGIETLHRMKDQEENQCEHTPIVALTANAITGAKEMYLAEGFDAFLPKPINPERLEQMILKLLPRELLLFDIDEEDIESKSDMEVVSVSPVDNMPDMEGVDWHIGFKHLPDKDLLMSTIEDLYKTMGVEADTLDGFYHQIDENPDMIVQYRIKVHSMKSSANLIGAIVLGSKAKMLEDAARNADLNLIHAVHHIFMSEWGTFRCDLAEAFDFLNNQVLDAAKTDINNYEEIIKYLQGLKSAIEDMDIDKMDELMLKLEAFKYPEVIQEKINKLSVSVTNMDNQQGNALIEEIFDDIRNGETL